MPKLVAASNRIYRVVAVTNSSGVIAPSCATTDVATVTINDGSGGGANSISNPTGTPTNGQRLSFRITQDGTGGRTLTWGNKYSFVRAAAAYLNPSANSVSLYEFQYDSGADLWRHLPDARWGVSRGVVGYSQRTTAYTGIPSDGVGEVVLTLEDVPVERGRAYQVIGHGEIECDTTSPSMAESHIKFTTDGSTPDSSDPNMTRELSVLNLTNVPATVHMVSIYRPSTSHDLSVALHAQGVFDPAHEYTYYAESGFPIYLSIEDVGPNLT